MKGIILLVALLCASARANYLNQNQLTRKDLSTTASIATPATIATREPLSSSSSTESSSTILNAESTVSSSTQDGSESQSPTIVWQPDESALPASPSLLDEKPPRRRIVTYDQRQEGQYNIHADLENFMIVLVPQGPSLFSELFLMRALKNIPGTTKEKSKHTNSFNVPSFLKNRDGSKRTPSLSYNSRPTFPHDDLTAGTKQPSVGIIEDGSGKIRRIPEFIEGRTPYHVDISASDDEQARLHPDRQVDVLPPPFPLAYQHLKPYHLEAEPTIIQALPPPELHAAHVPNSFLETYNHLLTSGLKSAADTGSRARYNNDGPEQGYYRISRSIRGGENAIDSDRSNALNSLSLQPLPPRHAELPLYRSEHSLGAANLYPPIDVPKAFGYITLRADDAQQASEFQRVNDLREQVLHRDTITGRDLLPTLDITVPQDDIELELHGVSLLDRAAKTLLSDGMERCAPGHRRDSYGLCREIEGY